MVEIKALKGDVGIVLLADLMMSFPVPPQLNQPNQPNTINFPHLLKQDDYPAYFLEIFFGFIVKKMRVFNRAFEDGEKILSQNKLDIMLSEIPTPDLQDTIQKLALLIGEKALSKKNDLKMKNLFFSVFIFCIKYTSKCLGNLS